MKVDIFYGGESPEHEVSILTALHTAKHVSREHSVRLCYISQEGILYKSRLFGRLSKYEFYRKARGKTGSINIFNSAIENWYVTKVGGGSKAVLNLCHGGAGEGGGLAGMCETFNIPITSCGSIAAQTLQSKSRTREILKQNGYAQPSWVVASSKQEFAKEMLGDLDFPLIVKPDTLGSSIGISVVHNDEDLQKAITLASLLDERILIEEFIEGCEEINCACFLYGDAYIISGIEVIKKSGEMLDFGDKYLDQGSGFIKKQGGKKSEQEHRLEKEIKEFTQKAYELFGCSGVVRADFLIKGDTIYLNEMNTVPGFMAYHLFQKIGLPYTTLIDMVLAESLDKNTKKRSTGPLKAFKSDVLEKNRTLAFTKSKKRV